ncbi:MAG: hypothetical protein M1820_003186 [Bogoriella megaspora]|nr:MAG: hypothetical protein M1820_003186 [Bogoriella megaspora]
MHVQIVLDNPRGVFTNLDVIAGKVILQLRYPVNVNSIIVKLEGESRTRLLAPPLNDRRDRPRPELEIHKILYKLQQVHPSPGVANPNVGNEWALSPGQHEWPFSFKIPFNNSCNASNNLNTNLSLAGLRLEVAKQPTRHVKKTLPPNLTGFPGMADIRYFVKVTVNRPQFFQQNPRAFAPFSFLPIEPPRPHPSKAEKFARRTFQFNIRSDNKMGGTFEETPQVRVDARLPEPPILTCNEDVPLRLLVTRLTKFPNSEPLFLQSLHIELSGYTSVRAHDIARKESTSWLIMSMSNMGIPIGSPEDPVGTEVPINREYWDGRPLENTVAPSFETCNLSRRYELEARVGLSYGHPKDPRLQSIVLPLRLDVQVYSGIAPPPALLKAMETDLPGNRPARPPRRSSAQHESTSPSIGASNIEGDGNGGPLYDDAPPSYEDAIAQDLPPVDGPRRDYAPPPIPEGQSGFPEEKGG